ncbi:MAG: hypothetical protein V5B60_00920 [Accumulibacter sp.]|jgi:hypothetical protein|uniref:hypothetical protein n=1 Tax=Accumulibacter sp. TaxID=2053492 RepID=UPI002FC3A741
MEQPRPAPLPRSVAWLGYGGLLPFLIAASHFPAWYLPLRFRLTTAAFLRLIAGAFAEAA